MSFAFGDMKVIALKGLITVLEGFAMYYTFFLGSVFYDLYGPSDRFCATAQVWALQGAAVFFAPPALLGSVGLWFVGKQKHALGRFFPLARKVSVIVLLLCAVINLAIFLPTL